MTALEAATTTPPRSRQRHRPGDDMGFSDPAAYGGEIRTPNIDDH